ncbi:DUF6157 family protein [Membranihabitans marinus]|uniref:DUF6157 family protein n=1 Tax=Membranihabitans marinus TaxID=1227546 RepID=UPI001F3738FC|nr:DUF6157 family protein [Membranihabitans marinus]
MKVHSTNYYNTFIEISEDSNVDQAQEPSLRAGKKTIALKQFELIHNHPYQFTSDEVMLEVHMWNKDINSGERQKTKETFFSKGQPCFRASALGKKWGWGIHHNEEGKMAIYGVESPMYMSFVEDQNIVKVKAMRSKRK